MLVVSLTVIKLVLVVVAVTLPLGYPEPGSVIRISVIVLSATLARALAVAPVLINEAAVFVDTATHVGTELGLPNPTAFHVVLADIVLKVQVSPSGLVAACVVPEATAKNNPCPYSTLVHVWLDGNPAGLLTHVVPPSTLTTAARCPVATATNLPLP